MVFGSPSYSSWKHHLLHRTNNYPGAGFTFQMTVNWRPGMQRDFRDIRFSSEKGETLGYYILSSTAGVSATVWVKTGSSTDFYLHFGNGAAKSESSGVRAFLLFDDFSTNRIATDYTEGHFTGASSYMPTHTVENGGYHCYNSSYADQDGGLLANTTTAVATISHINCVYTNRLGSRSPPWVVVPCVGYGTNVGSYIGTTMGYWGSIQAGLNPNSPSDDIIIEWHNGTTTNNVKVWRGASLINTQSKNHSTHKKPYFAVRTASQEKIDCYFKDFFVRKYVATEPTATVISPVLYYNDLVSEVKWLRDDFTADMQIPKVLMDIEFEGRFRNSSLRYSENLQAYHEWMYVREYNISNFTANSLVTFTVPWRPGMRADFRDVRFSDMGDKKLRHYRDSYTAGSTAVFTVELKSSPTVFLHYGNGSPYILTESTTAIFLYFDDFTSDTSANYSVNTTGTIAYDGTLKCLKQTNNNAVSHWIVCNNYTLPSAFVFEADYKVTNDQAARNHGGNLLNWAQSVFSGYRLTHLDGKFVYSRYVEGAENEIGSYTESNVYADDRWVHYRISRTAAGVMKITHSYGTYSVTTDVTEATWSGGSFGIHSYGCQTYMTNVKVKPYCSTDPVAAYVGSWTKPLLRNMAALFISSGTAYDREADMFCLPQALGSWSGGFLRQSDNSVPICEVLAERTRSFARDGLVFVPTLNEDVQVGVSTSSEVPAVQSLSERLLAGLRQSDSSVPIPEVLGERALTFARESLLSVLPVNEDVQTGVSTASSIPVVQSLSERVVSGLREASMTVDTAKSLLEWSLAMARESAVSVPSVQGSAGFGIAASMSIPAPEMLFVAGNVLEREASASVAAVFSEAAKQLIMSRGSDLFVQILQTLVEPEFTFGRTASVSVHSPQIGATYVYIRAEPNSPFFYTVLKRTYDADLSKLTFYVDLGKIQYYATLRDGETMYELTQYDSDTFTASLYDTDPLTNTRRLMPLSGYTVQAVLKGGIHVTTITKDCTVLGAGSVTFSLDSADTVTPGLYSIKFLITDAGTGFRKEVPENLSEVQKIRINDKLYTS